MSNTKELKLKTDTLKMLDEHQLNKIEGGMEEATTWACVYRGAGLLAAILTAGEANSWWACAGNPGREGVTNGTQGTQYVLEGGCLLCEVVVGGIVKDDKSKNFALAIGIVDESIGIDYY